MLLAGIGAVFKSNLAFVQQLVSPRQPGFQPSEAHIVASHKQRKIVIQMGKTHTIIARSTAAEAVVFAHSGLSFKKSSSYFAFFFRSNKS